MRKVILISSLICTSLFSFAQGLWTQKANGPSVALNSYAFTIHSIGYIFTGAATNNFYAYDPATVFSSIDHQGRYAFGQQPAIAAWNLARLAEALLPILYPEPETALAKANELLESFEGRFRRHWLAAMRGKLGLFSEERDDVPLIEELLRWMHETRADYTHTFRNLRSDTITKPASQADDAFSEWHRRWTERLARQPQSSTEVTRLMNAHNPAIIPRNHVVEAALAAANIGNDLAPLERLLTALATPYDEAGQPAELLNPPPPDTPACRTFCGT